MSRKAEEKTVVREPHEKRLSPGGHQDSIDEPMGSEVAERLSKEIVTTGRCRSRRDEQVGIRVVDLGDQQITGLWCSHGGMGASPE